MICSKSLFFLAIIALIMLFVYPIQSISINDQATKLATRHKRWTFNTWRLHGRRQLSNDLYSPMAAANEDEHYDMFNNDDDIGRRIHERLLQYFRGTHHQ